MHWIPDNHAGHVHLDVGDIVSSCRLAGAKVLYLCVPNNPSGVGIPATGLVELAQALPDVMVIWDAAFSSVSDLPYPMNLTLPGNLVRVVSLTKTYALAGLRLGYMQATPAIIQKTQAEIPPWTVNALAQKAAITIAENPVWQAQRRQAWLAQREYVLQQLGGLSEHLGVTVQPGSAAPYMLVQVPNGTELRQRLFQREHILVRACDSFGLPNHIRVCARPKNDVDRLVLGLSRILS